jgi:hypothetical protein
MDQDYDTETREEVPEDQICERVTLALAEASMKINTRGCEFAAVVVVTPDGEGYEFSTFSAGDNLYWAGLLSYIADVAAPDVFQRFLSFRAAQSITRQSNLCH